MKLLIITNIPTPYRLAFYNLLSQKLKEEGGELKVLFCSKSEPNRHWGISMSEQKLDFEFLKGFHLNFNHYFLHFNPVVIRKIRCYEPDVVLYSGSWNMLTVVFSVLYFSLFRKKWKSLFWSEGHEDSVIFKKGIVPKLRLSILNKFDGFAVPNERSSAYLFDYLHVKERPVVFLPNTINNEFYTKPTDWTEADTVRVKSKYGIDRKSSICIQVSQVEDRKGVPELVSFWHYLDPAVKKGYTLVLAGEGSLRAELEEYCKGKGLNDVIFTGNRKMEEVRDLLFASSFFILLTKNDPNPLTLIEAIFAGLPILTTRFAGNCNEIITGSENGCILNKITSEEFSKAFIRLTELASTRTAGLVSFDNAKGKFDINKVTCDFIVQLHSLKTELSK
jgi:glycosyltransferase involved in cell wall biosynthesis